MRLHDHGPNSGLVDDLVQDFGQPRLGHRIEADRVVRKTDTAGDDLAQDTHVGLRAGVVASAADGDKRDRVVNH